MITAYFKEFLSGTHAFWLSTVSSENMPDATRCSNPIVMNETTIRCVVSERFSKHFLENIKSDKQVSFLATHMFTYESYQFKGEVEEVLPATKEELKLDYIYYNNLADIMRQIGLDRDKAYGLFYQQPSFTVVIKLNSVFDQVLTPNPAA